MSADNHKFIVKRANDVEWHKGLRTDFEYCDLGIAEATDGDFGAHIIRIAEPGEHRTGRHSHTTGFQMIYVLEGEAKFWFDGAGEISVSKGDCFYQPDGIVHDGLWFSDDCKLLEITAPGKFETVEH